MRMVRKKGSVNDLNDVMMQAGARLLLVHQTVSLPAEAAERSSGRPGGEGTVGSHHNNMDMFEH